MDQPQTPASQERHQAPDPSAPKHRVGRIYKRGTTRHRAAASVACWSKYWKDYKARLMWPTPARRRHRIQGPATTKPRKGMDTGTWKLPVAHQPRVYR